MLFLSDVFIFLSFETMYSKDTMVMKTVEDDTVKWTIYMSTCFRKPNVIAPHLKYGAG